MSFCNFLILTYIGIRQWPESFVVLLASCVPKGHIELLPIDCQIVRVVIKPVNTTNLIMVFVFCFFWQVL